METKKLTEEEISEIKVLSNDFNQTFTNLGIVQSQIAELEIKRDMVYEDLSVLRKNEKELFEKLKTKYGEGVVDLNTGEFKSEK